MMLTWSPLPGPSCSPPFHTPSALCGYSRIFTTDPPGFSSVTNVFENDEDVRFRPAEEGSPSSADPPPDPSSAFRRHASAHTNPRLTSGMLPSPSVSATPPYRSSERFVTLASSAYGRSAPAGPARRT